MSRKDKLFDRIVKKPRDFTYDELKQLLGSLNCLEDDTGKTSGSRVSFIHKPSKAVLRLHKPHPGNELKAYQIRMVLDFLKSIGEI
ncbi:MAG: type II toxin-antitoxin system HicA family toxin [Eubacteriales bacterium]|nr:type II toxin-antitoxin system HicA family toxin [Eubacteriales bacterium]